MANAKINEENIVASLKVIQQVCKDHQPHNCTKCPFNIESESGYNVCGVIDTEPDNWEILEYKKFQALG